MDDKLQFTYNSLKEILSRPIEVDVERHENAKNALDYVKYKITEIVEEIHRLDLLPDELSVTQLLQSSVEYPLSRLLEQIKKPWLDDKIVIGLMGHYTTGKTTVLNSVFDEKFPVDSAESTALATYLCYGEHNNNYVLVDKQGNVQRISENDASLFDHSVVDDFPLARIFDYMVKENSSELLRNISFIDTPGLDSNQVEHSYPTINAANHCDIVFWFSRSQPLDVDSIKFIKEHLSGKKLYFIFTFTDARGVHNVDELIKEYIQTAKDNDIECEGFLKYGRREETINHFKEDFNKTIESILENNDKYNPLVIVLCLLQYMETILTSRQEQLNKGLSEISRLQNSIMDKFEASSRTFNTSYSNMTNRLNSMINTFRNRCSNASLCLGASGALAADITQIISSTNALADAYNAIENRMLVQYGELSAYESRVQEQLKVIDVLLKETRHIQSQLNPNNND